MRIDLPLGMHQILPSETYPPSEMMQLVMTVFLEKIFTEWPLALTG